jgi:hypothetical protein
MKNHKNIPNTTRAKVGASCALGAAVSTTLLNPAVSYSTNGLGALAFGLFMGVLAWLGHGHVFPADAGGYNNQGLGRWSRSLSKTYVLTTVVSTFFMSFGWAPYVKLIGFAGNGVCLGFVIAAAVANRSK